MLCAANQPENADPDGGGGNEVDTVSDSDEDSSSSMISHDILVVDEPEMLEPSDPSDNGEEQIFDIALAASHSVSRT